jgi:hypothetical protein
MIGKFPLLLKQKNCSRKSSSLLFWVQHFEAGYARLSGLADSTDPGLG